MFVELREWPLTPAHLLRWDALDALVVHLRTGGLVVLPTETGPLLGARADDAAAVERVFEAKGRPAGNPMHVAVCDLAMAAGLASLTPTARRLLARCVPGPLTVVAACRAPLPARLLAGGSTLGLRVPDHPATLQVVAALGAPLTATSLNLSGRGPEADWRATLGALRIEPGATVHAVDDPQAVRYALPSTVVSCVGEPWRLLREGPLSAAQVAAALQD